MRKRERAVRMPDSPPEEVLRSFLNLARKAGRLAIGHHAVRQALGRGRCHLLIFASDAGASLQRLDRGDLPVLRPADKTTLGEWLGRSEVAILGLTDPHMAGALLEKSAASQNDPATGR